MDYENHEIETPAAEEDDVLVLKPLRLPSGGSVTFHDPEELNGRDVRWLRKAVDAPGNGSATNQLYERAMVLLVESWELPYASLRIPRHDKTPTKSESVEKLRARDMRAIERHLSPVLKAVVRQADPDGDEDSDGSSPS